MRRCVASLPQHNTPLCSGALRLLHRAHPRYDRLREGDREGPQPDHPTLSLTLTLTLPGARDWPNRPRLSPPL
eukprot:4397055-Prymnesium_polylepis.1